MSCIGYAYPWDLLDDPAAAPRYADTALTSVAVAASYHATRAATPLHPRHRTLSAPHAAFYLPVRPSAWTGRLVARQAAFLPVPDSFAIARRALRRVGLACHAWVVLTHNSGLGADNPDLVVRNAFGEPYPWALCPSSDDVVEYCATVVREMVLLGEPDGVILEACGPLGVVHGGQHDKIGLAGWDRVQLALLSLCFCIRCAGSYERAGVDVAGLQGAVRRVVDAAPVAGRCEGDIEAALAQDLGSAAARTVRETRQAATARLQHEVIAAARAVVPGLPIRLHATADPWATGPFAPLAADPSLLDGVVVSGETPAATAGELRAVRAAVPERVATGGYLRVDPAAALGEADVEQYVISLRRAGMSEAHVYHLGLAGRSGLELIAQLAEIATATAPAAVGGDGR